MPSKNRKSRFQIFLYLQTVHRNYALILHSSSTGPHKASLNVIFFFFFIKNQSLNPFLGDRIMSSEFDVNTFTTFLFFFPVTLQVDVNQHLARGNKTSAHLIGSVKISIVAPDSFGWRTRSSFVSLSKSSFLDFPFLLPAFMPSWEDILNMWSLRMFDFSPLCCLSCYSLE